MNPAFKIQLTREQFEAARAKLTGQGISLNGDSGEIEGHKVGVAFSYDGTDLTLTIEHKPFYYPADSVEKEIRSWFRDLS